MEWTPAIPPAAAERIDERLRLVSVLAGSSENGRDPVSDPEVLRAMASVPRHAFVPPEYQDLAYQDCPLPIGHGQTISQPYIVAKMTELLAVAPESRILEIGTGSGYQCAVLAHLAPNVRTLETRGALAARAERLLRAQGYVHVRFRTGDGYSGWPEAAPFDRILVTCAVTHLPRPLWDQLAPSGRIVLPIGSSSDHQWLGVIEKTAGGTRRARVIMPVRFVPMVR